MERRRWIFVVLLTTLGAACGGGSSAPATQPNLVLVLLDNLDQTTSPYWEAMPKTRELMGDRGLVFKNAFVSAPICSPTRASILTGQYAHNTGVLTNGGPNGGWARFHDGGGEARTFPIALQEAGYRTALIGKYLNGYDSDPTFVPPGWDQWFVDIDTNLPNGFNYTLNENGVLRAYGSSEADYNTDVFARLAMATIERFSALGLPFFVFIAPTAPHVPIAAPPRYTEHPWAHATVPPAPNYNEPDLSDKPEWLQRSESARRRLAAWNDFDYRNRMGSLLAVDDLMANVFDALERTGELDDTYVVFTSDNGYNLGSHVLIHMMAPYEESLRVPFVVIGPGVPQGTEERMIVLHDLAPTVLELAGVPVPEWIDGRSVVSLLRGDNPAIWRVDFLAEYETGWAHRGFGWGLPEPEYFEEQILGGQDIPSYRAVRTEHHAFIEWAYDDGSGRRTALELYDLEDDPYELENLLAGPDGHAEHAGLVADLQTRLERLSTCAGTACD